MSQSRDNRSKRRKAPCRLAIKLVPRRRASATGISPLATARAKSCRKPNDEGTTHEQFLSEPQCDAPPPGHCDVRNRADETDPAVTVSMPVVGSKAMWTVDSTDRYSIALPHRRRRSLIRRIRTRYLNRPKLRSRRQVLDRYSGITDTRWQTLNQAASPSDCAATG